MISLEAARSVIAAQILPVDAVRTPLAAAPGLVLREDILAPEDFPAFDRSAMDGYALGAEDSSERFEVIGEVRPGELPAMEVQTGQCVRIFTGGRLPAGASQVLMQEHARREGQWMSPLRREPALHVRKKGEDARQGDVVLRAGNRLRPAERALLAQVGAVFPLVSPAVRVLHLATGDELVAPDCTPGPGQIRDSNSTLVAGLLGQCGARLVRQWRCADDAVLGQVGALEAEDWDLLLISGGASVGDYDFGVRALEALGFQIHFQSVNLRPGKPVVFGTRGRHAAFVIPGNPVSHFVVFEVAIRLAIERFEGAASSWAPVEIALGAALPGEAGPRETFWPAALEIEAGALRVRPLAWRSSGDLCGLVGVSALIQVPAGSPAAAIGSPVRCVFVPPL